MGYLLVFHCFKFKRRLPFATEQYDFRSKKENKSDGEEVDEVAGVDNPFAYSKIVMFNTERFDEASGISEDFKRVDELEPEVDEKAKYRSQKEGDDLAVGDGGGENADGDKDDAEQEQPQIGTEGASEVDVADRVAEPPHRIDVDEGGQQRNQQQCGAGQKLRPDDLVVGQGFGEQQLHRTGFLFFRKRPHGDGGDEEQEKIARKVEKPLQVSGFELKNVVVVRENPDEKPRDDQERGDDDVPDDGAEKGLDFFDV